MKRDGCGRRKFRRRAQAKAALTTMRETVSNSTETLKVFRCADCSAFHVTAVPTVRRTLGGFPVRLHP